MRTRINLFIIILIFGGNLYFSDIALAYQDLGSGSYFIQIILAALFGGSFFLTKYWKKVKTFLVNLFKRKANPNDGPK